MWSVCGAEEKYMQSFGGEILRKKTVWQIWVWVGGEY
jgi:hypothetical protein